MKRGFRPALERPLLELKGIREGGLPARCQPMAGCNDIGPP